ncbi:MAG: hypothetical protein IKN04_17855 [Clostridia bacterium]|nr:hypothetical protein [Clostridia bacterium]
MSMYDPAAISACELPIYYQATQHYNQLWSIRDAQHFCSALCQLAAVPGITPEQYAAAAKVASGDPWPVPETVYDKDAWSRDRTFSAVPGQEVDHEVYEEMLCVLPPYNLPRCRRTEGYSAGFLTSEPVTAMNGKDLFSAFGKRNGRYYYIGLLPAYPGEEWGDSQGEHTLKYWS